MKKIICIHLLNDYSGSPLVLSQVINALLENQYSVDLYTNDTEGFLSPLKCNKINVPYKRSDKKWRTLFYFLLSQVLLLIKLLKYKNSDVIFYINTMLPFGAGIAGKLLGKKVIYHIHETSIKPYLLKRFLIKIIALTSMKNIYVSRYLSKAENINQSKSFTIYNALPKQFINRAHKHKYNSNNAQFNVLMLCNLKDYKGVTEFVSLSLACKEASSVTFTLVLNAPQPEIDDYFENIKYSSNLLVFPSQEDVHIYYEKATIVLNLSKVDMWVETFGMTILEAMSYGIPCIVPPIGGPTELIDEGLNGYLINSHDIDRLSQLIISLESNREKLKNLSKNARAKSFEFEQDVFIKNILKVIAD